MAPLVESPACRPSTSPADAASAKDRLGGGSFSELPSRLLNVGNPTSSTEFRPLGGPLLFAVGGPATPGRPLELELATHSKEPDTKEFDRLVRQALHDCSELLARTRKLMRRAQRHNDSE